MPVLSIEKVPEDGHATGRYVTPDRKMIFRVRGGGGGGGFSRRRIDLKGEGEKEKGEGRGVGRVIKVQRGGNGFYLFAARRF